MLISRVVVEDKLVVAKVLGEESVVEALLREATKAYKNVEVIQQDTVKTTTIVQCLADSNDGEGKIGLYVEFDRIYNIEHITANCYMSEIEKVSEDIVEFLNPMISKLN